jgi:hypothetical protein
MTELDTNALREASDLLATAAALGLPVTAPSGTTAYQIRLHPNHYGSDLDPNQRTLDNQGVPLYIHATYEGALAELASYAIAKFDAKRFVKKTPWGCPDFYDTVTSEEWRADMTGWVAREREAQDKARDAWVATHTNHEIVETLLGEENKRWAIRQIRIQP